MQTAKHIQIYEELKQAFSGGVYLPGDQLPTEKQLSEQYAVSRQTVLKALERLRAEKKILSYRGKGTFVAGKNASVPDIVRHYDRKQFAFLAPNLQDSFGLSLLTAIEKVSAEKGYSLRVNSSLYQEKREAEYLLRTVEENVSGLFIIPFLQNNYEHLRQVAEKIPVVCIDHAVKGLKIPVVSPNHYQASYDAVRYLIQQGHRRIGFIISAWSFLDSSPSVSGRFQGYRDALRDAGIAYDRNIVKELGETLASRCPREVGLELFSYPAMHQILSAPSPPTAVLLLWDEMAPGAYSAIRNAGKKIPEDISLISFNNEPLCSALSPGLSSMELNPAKIAEEAVAILLRLSKGETVSLHTETEATLIIRGSVKNSNES